MPKSKKFRLILISFIFGIGSGGWFKAEGWDFLLMVAFGVLLCIILKKCYFLCLMILLLFLGGNAIFQQHDERYYRQNITQFIDEGTVEFQGVVSDYVLYGINKQKIVLDVKSISRLPDRKVAGRVIISAHRYPQFKYGEELKVVGHLNYPENFNGFDYINYLKKEKISLVCYYPKIEKTGEDQGHVVMTFFYGIKARLDGALSNNIKLPESGVVKAMLIGQKEDISDGLKELFAKTGTGHLIAISGMHINIIIVMLMNFLLSVGVNRSRSFWIIVLIMSAYLLVICFPASAVRACLMGGIVLYGKKIGRPASSYNVLLFAAALMLVHNPFLLFWDIGFQLSFLAVLGLMAYPKYIKGLIPYRLEFFGIKENAAATISAQLSTLPLIVYYFGNFSTVSVLANIIILPLIPWIIMLGIMGLVLHLLAPAFSSLFFSPVFFITKIVLEVLQYFSALSFSSLSFPKYDLFGMSVCFVITFLIYLFFKLILGKKS